MIYLKSFSLPSQEEEYDFLKDSIQPKIYSTIYPFGIFYPMELEDIQFSDITIFYGNNGSGKTTLLNVIAAKLNISHKSAFNHTPLMDDFVELCEMEMPSF